MTALWVALVDELVDELVLSIKMSGTRRYINLGTFDEFLLELSLQLPLLLSPPSSSYLPTGLALFLPPLTTPTSSFLGFANLILEVFSIEISGVTI